MVWTSLRHWKVSRLRCRLVDMSFDDNFNLYRCSTDSPPNLSRFFPHLSFQILRSMKCRLEKRKHGIRKVSSGSSKTDKTPFHLHLEKTILPTLQTLLQWTCFSMSNVKSAPFDSSFYHCYLWFFRSNFSVLELASIELRIERRLRKLWFFDPFQNWNPVMKRILKEYLEGRLQGDQTQDDKLG